MKLSRRGLLASIAAVAVSPVLPKVATKGIPTRGSDVVLTNVGGVWVREVCTNWKPHDNPDPTTFSVFRRVA